MFISSSASQSHPAPICGANSWVGRQQFLSPPAERQTVPPPILNSVPLIPGSHPQEPVWPHNYAPPLVFSVTLNHIYTLSYRTLIQLTRNQINDTQDSLGHHIVKARTNKKWMINGWDKLLNILKDSINRSHLDFYWIGTQMGFERKVCVKKNAPFLIILPSIIIINA